MVNKRNIKKTKKDQTEVNAVIDEVKVNEESQLIAAALGELSPGTQASADFFNEKLPEGSPARVSRASVWNWVHGVYRVDVKRLNVWKVIYPPDDKRHQLAVDLLAERQREFAAHWVGSEYPKVTEEELAISNGTKLLEKVRPAISDQQSAVGSKRKAVKA